MDDQSATSTVAQSHEPSVLEKAELPATEPEDESKEVEEADNVPAEDLNEKAADALDRTQTGVSTVSTEPDEYPGGAKLLIITFALCLSVFCVALVCIYFSTSLSQCVLIMARTTPSSPPQFLASPINFTP